MSKKIEGFIDERNLERNEAAGPHGVLALWAKKGEGKFRDLHATTIIHDGQPEPCFTASEVRAMINDVKAIAAENAAKAYTSWIEQMTPPAPVAFHIDNYMWKTHGITLDPA